MSAEKQSAKQMTDDTDTCPEVEQETRLEPNEQGDRQIVAESAEVLPFVPVTLHEPDALLVAHQVTDSVNVPAGDYALEWQLRSGAVALYAAIEPRDALESILARMAVGLSNGIMDCLGRAARHGEWLKSRDVNLRHAIKGSLAVTEMVKAIDNHRGRDRQKVSVGQVNVQSGGQAIVGNVERRGHQDHAPEPAPIPITARDPDDGQEE